MSDTAMEIVIKEMKEKHRQALTSVVWQMSFSINDQLTRLQHTIRDELGTNDCDGAFARIREDMKAIEFSIWRSAKAARRKAGQ